jgi:hypothetical protein
MVNNTTNPIKLGQIYIDIYDEHNPVTWHTVIEVNSANWQVKHPNTPPIIKFDTGLTVNDPPYDDQEDGWSITYETFTQVFKLIDSN